MEEALYDEPNGRIDDRLDGRMDRRIDVDLDGGGHPGGDPAGHRYYEATQELILCSGLPRSADTSLAGAVAA